MSAEMGPNPMDELEAKRAADRAAMEARNAELRQNLQDSADSGQIVEPGYGAGTPATAGEQTPESQDQAA